MFTRKCASRCQTVDMGAWRRSRNTMRKKHLHIWENRQCQLHHVQLARPCSSRHATFFFRSSFLIFVFRKHRVHKSVGPRITVTLHPAISGSFQVAFSPFRSPFLRTCTMYHHVLHRTQWRVLCSRGGVERFALASFCGVVGCTG